ncbi:hypothetical protein V6259_12860 [Marinomonas sp. TI.3.20]|uniref:hypothetical protein n=1 Tax=Marinomonas sp. TI.3.20 TaxID=3121296 RepID=UPI00311DA374
MYLRKDVFERTTSHYRKSNQKAFRKVFGRGKGRYFVDPELIGNPDYRIAALLPTGGTVLVRVSDRNVQGCKDPQYMLYYSDRSPFKEGDLDYLVKKPTGSAPKGYTFHTRTISGTVVLRRNLH